MKQTKYPLWREMVEAFLHQRGNHPGHIGGVDTDSVRLFESTVLNTEGKTHAHNEQLPVRPIASRTYCGYNTSSP